MWKCSYRCEKSQYLSVFLNSFTKFFKRRKPIDHSPRKIGKHLTSEKKHVRKTEKPILPKWFTYTEWKVYDMGRFSRIWARVKDSSLAGLSGSNRRGWELIVALLCISRWKRCGSFTFLHSTYYNFVHIQATRSSHAVSDSANNGNDVGHTNGDLHAANVDNNHGSDNNGDHASIMWWLCLVAKHGCDGGFFFCRVVLLHIN